jgi:hypothetical protein
MLHVCVSPLDSRFELCCIVHLHHLLYHIGLLRLEQGMNEVTCRCTIATHRQLGEQSRG